MYSAEKTSTIRLQREHLKQRRRRRTVRTVDGTYNDLEHPRMGSAGMRFGRNVPIGETYPEKDEKLLSPNRLNT